MDIEGVKQRAVAGRARMIGGGERELVAVVVRGVRGSADNPVLDRDRPRGGVPDHEKV